MKIFRVEIVHTEAETNKKLKLTVMIFFFFRNSTQFKLVIAVVN